jgi:putative DNA primase/helicase
MGVDRVQRFSAANPCPVCNGYDEAARGTGARCFGFLSDDGRYAHCSREEYAGTLERNATSATYCHYLGSGTCRCGNEHSGTIPAHTAANGKAETKRRANFEQPKDTVYFYRLPSGEAIYAAIRFGGKKPSYPAYKKDGVWWLGTPEDYSPLPYNLPGVMQAALEGKPVDIFEGESDVEEAKKLGLYATTNMMGACKFSQELVPYFRGLDVRINQDNDAPGKDHALDVAHKLFGTAKSIKVIPPFPGVPEGGDFKDWIAAGGTKEKYLRMVDEAGDPFEPDSNPRHGGSGSNTSFPVYKVRKIKELNEEGAGEGWFCPLFMRAGEITLFGGAAKESGKTTFYAHMLKCVHDGKPFMGMPTIKCGALVLTEQGTNILESTAKAGISDDDEIYFAFYKDLVNEDWNDLLEAAVTVCERLSVKILVVDTLTAFAELHGSDENLSGEIIARMKPVLSAARVHGLHVSILHHTGKDGEIRGSSALYKDPDAIWVLVLQL